MAKKTEDYEGIAPMVSASRIRVNWSHACPAAADRGVLVNEDGLASTQEQAAFFIALVLGLVDGLVDEYPSADPDEGGVISSKTMAIKRPDEGL